MIFKVFVVPWTGKLSKSILETTFYDIQTICCSADGEVEQVHFGVFSWFKLYSNYIQIIFKLDSNKIQIRFKLDSNDIQIRFKLDSN